MKLLVISESPLEQNSDGYFAVDTWIRFPMRLSNILDKVTVLAPIRKVTAPSAGTWKLTLGQMRIAHHDDYSTFQKCLQLYPTKYFIWKSKLRDLISQHDAVLFRTPSPILGLVCNEAKRQHKPLFLFIVLNIENTDRVFTLKGLKRIVFKLMIQLLVFWEKKHARSARLIFSFSKELSLRHKKLSSIIREVRLPHTSIDEFFYRDDTCLNSTIRILRVAWLIPLKGLERLFQSILLLKQRGHAIHLEVIGKERVAGYQQQLENVIRSLGLENEITLCGWIPYDNIKKYYSQSDIQVISSLTEGTPRCIIEGASCSLPLVSTDVGGCKDVLTDKINALLIKPNDSLAMANAIEKIIVDKELRQQLIRNGREMAKQFTFESLGEYIVSEMKGNLS